MKIDDNFIELIQYNATLNKKQCEILGLSFPHEDNWDYQVIGNELSTKDTNLLILLKGKLALKTQDQITKNYQTLSSFRNPKIEKITQDEPQVNNSTNEDVNNVMENISIYCDGACSGNPGQAGSGVAVYSKDNKPVLYHGDYIKNGTNNIAELNALYKALLISEELNTNSTITILSDSKYSIDCISTWAYGWKAKGWTKKGGEIKNLQLIKNAHTLFEKIKNKIIIKHVKGHAGIEGNELADRMAVYTIKAKNEKYETYTYDNVSDVLNLTSY